MAVLQQLVKKQRAAKPEEKQGQGREQRARQRLLNATNTSTRLLHSCSAVSKRDSGLLLLSYKKTSFSSEELLTLGWSEGHLRSVRSE